MKHFYLTLGLFFGLGSAANAQYCTGGPSSIYDSNVGSVDLAGETTSISYSGCASGNGVAGTEDQTGSTPADLLTGYQYTLDIEWSTCGGTYGNAGEAWIDFNGDQIFDPSESVAQWSGSPSYLGSYTFVVPINATLGTTRLRVMQQEGGTNPLSSCATYTWGSMTDFTIDIGAGLTCNGVSNLVVDNVNADSAFFSFTAGGTETDWNVQYGPQGFALGSGTSFSTTDMNDTITGLAANSFYEVYVQSVCGVNDTSNWVGPVLFNTFDIAPFLDFNQICGTGFEDISTIGTVHNLWGDQEFNVTLPFNFILDGMVSDKLTVGDNGGIEFGTHGAQINWFNNPIVSALPGFYPFWDDFGGGDIYTHTLGTAPNRRYIIQWDNYNHYSGDEGTWQVVLYESTFQITFNYEDVNFGAATVDYGAGATVGVKGPSQASEFSFNQPSLSDGMCINWFYTNCPKPNTLTADYVGIDTVIFSWTAGGSETEWVVEWGPAGFTPGTGTTFTTTDMTDTITGLTQITDYDIYVVSVCSANDTSTYAGPLSIQTEPICPNPSNVTLDFTSNDTIAISWVSNGSETEWNIQYGYQGFAIGSGDVLFTTENPDTLTGITQGMVYDVYVQSHCNAVDTSLWIGPLQVITDIPNDSACGAIDLAIDGITRWYSNIGATNTGDPGNTPNASVWFSFKAPASGAVSISTCGTPFDTELQVFSADSCDGTMTSLGYADYNPWNCSGSHPAGIELCGLNSGETYYFWVGPWSTWSPTQGTFPVTIDEIPFTNAGLDSTTQICSGDVVDLTNFVSGTQMTGVFEDPSNTGGLNGSMLSTGTMAYINFDMYYIVSNLCHSDTAVIDVAISGPSHAGMGTTITSVCNTNAAINLMDGLTGSVDLGGTWTSVSGAGSLVGNTLIPDTSMQSGTYDYEYVVSNGVCPADTSIVSVEILNCVGLDELDASMLTIYPNPTRDVVHVDGLVQGANIELYDMIGKQLINHTVESSSYSMSLAHLNPGTYIIRVVMGEGELFSRIVIQ